MLGQMFYSIVLDRDERDQVRCTSAMNFFPHPILHCSSVTQHSGYEEDG